MKNIMKFFQNHLLVLHPFLFGVYPIAALYAHNVGQIPFVETIRSLLVTLAVVGAPLLALGLLSRGWRKTGSGKPRSGAAERGGLAISAVIVLFFSFGHVYGFINTNLSGGRLVVPANVLAAVWAAALILLPWAVLRLLKPAAARDLTQILNVVSAAALLLSLAPIFTYTIHNLRTGQSRVIEQESPSVNSGGSGAADPDIYYIILDGYGGEGVLRDLYGIDENPLVDFLEENGFTVAAQSHSNYGRTQLSLASSLNQDYVGNLLELKPESSDATALDTLIQHSAVYHFLKERWYRVVAFGNGFAFSEVREADVFMTSAERLNHFESMLLTNSLAVLWLDQAANDDQRRDILGKFELLARIPELDGPTFVFAHVVFPHPPFLFDRHGNPVTPQGAGDGPYYYGTRESYLQGYHEQLLYANSLVEETIRAILRDSPTPPVIIIQGDHGPGAYWSFDALEASCLRERFSILNAYYLPGKPEAGLYPDITPVNSFRVVFNAYFDQQLPLLEDRAFYATWERPFALTDISDRLDSCAPLDAGAK